MSFGGRIKRGPMAADVFEQQFTQIYNGLFRDTRLSFKAKGIFGLISTHRDGFGVSLESIAACSTDGIAGVRTGLQELIKYQYLQRDRTRDDLGRLGDSVYFITDMPDGLIILMNPGWDVPEVETGRSEPKCDSPMLAEPTLAEPTVGDRSHKKTTSKYTNRKKSLSPRVPRQAAPEPPAAPNDERETTPSTEQAAAIAAAYTEALGRPVSPTTRNKIQQQAAELLTAGFPAWWLTDRARELAAKGWTDLAQHADRSTVPTVRKATATNAGWCGQCDDPNYRQIRDPARDHELVDCPACNPVALARARRAAQQGAAA